MTAETFRALWVEETAGGRFTRRIAERTTSDLPPGDVLIRVSHSSLNYKDALSATGNRGVTRTYPHTPGIDAAGVVAESAVSAFRPGDEVLVTGYDLGMNTAGGFGGYVRVPAGWIVRLPQGMSRAQSMAYGTAGFTAALGILRIERGGVRPEHGPVLVTGATGGVGSLAVGMLARAGYTVAAVTGKPEARGFLEALGAREIIPRAAAVDTSRPLLKSRWAGVIDTVGGEILATALASTTRRAVVTCCGLVASPQLATTVFPFILRGVTLAGIDSAECPMDERLQAWERIAGDWRLGDLGAITTKISLDELSGRIDRILAGQERGRVVVAHEGRAGR
jgi:acrylyl-CoA reductase (NADPH)